jgi:hypothetical protein
MAGSVVLVAAGLPAVAEGRAYTLWLIRGDSPRAVHQFRLDDRVSTLELVPARVEGYAAAAITEEAAAEELPPVPTGPLLLHGDLCPDCG